MCVTFVQCWSNVEDVGPTLYKYYTNVLCLLGMLVYSDPGDVMVASGTSKQASRPVNFYDAELFLYKP